MEFVDESASEPVVVNNQEDQTVDFILFDKAPSGARTFAGDYFCWTGDNTIHVQGIKDIT